MRNPIRTLGLISLVVCLASPGLFAQDPPATDTEVDGATTDSGGSQPVRPTAASDRLILNFVEDATIVENQWWEGQFEYADLDSGYELFLLRGIVAFQPWKNVELGGRFGFGKSDAPSGELDGNGATDLDLWGKYYFLPNRKVELTTGGLLTIPTGDEAARLGWDSFGVKGFLSGRGTIGPVILSGQVGVQFNGDGSIVIPVGDGTARKQTIDGKTSFHVSGGVLFPISDVITFIGEVDYKTKRFDGAENDARILGGFSWRIASRGSLRTSLAFGVTDGAPDAQLLVSYAYQF
jgi:hypothetical protein